MLGELTDKILKKSWTDAEIKNFVGKFDSCHLSYATDPSLRKKSASGGTTTALLVHGLNNHIFDGAIVCKTRIQDGKVRPYFGIATTAQQVIESQGSKYVETRFLHEVLPLIREFRGKLAVVGLPCDISALKRRYQKEPEFENKIIITIALVCGHNSRRELIDKITTKLEKESDKRLKNYRFRIGHWRGKLEAEFDDGSVIAKESKYFNDYQNLFFFSERKCMACYDHYGYSSDISIGDIWLFKLKNNPIKYSAIILRTETGKYLYNSLIDSGEAFSTHLDIRDILDGQSRIGPSHYNVTARCIAGKLLGFKLKDPVKQPVKWHAYLNALITLANIKLSESRWGAKIVFLLPRPVLKFYLYIKKGLESLK